MSEAILPYHLVALSAFSCTRSTENYNILHSFLIVYNDKLFNLYLFVYNSVDISELTTLLVIVESITHNEIIGNFYCSVFYI